MRYCTTLALLLFIAPVYAADEGAADYRHHTMEAVGGHMQALVDIAKQKVPHGSHIAMHVNAIAEIAQIADTLFPEGSDGGDALPAIWENPDDFAERVQAFKVSSAALRDVVGSGDMQAMGAAMGRMGEACKGCHDNYKAE